MEEGQSHLRFLSGNEGPHFLTESFRKENGPPFPLPAGGGLSQGEGFKPGPGLDSASWANPRISSSGSATGNQLNLERGLSQVGGFKPCREAAPAKKVPGNAGVGV